MSPKLRPRPAATLGAPGRSMPKAFAHERTLRRQTGRVPWGLHPIDRWQPLLDGSSGSRVGLRAGEICRKKTPERMIMNTKLYDPHEQLLPARRWCSFSVFDLAP